MTAGATAAFRRRQLLQLSLARLCRCAVGSRSIHTPMLMKHGDSSLVLLLVLLFGPFSHPLSLSHPHTLPPFHAFSSAGNLRRVRRLAGGGVRSGVHPCKASHVHEQQRRECCGSGSVLQGENPAGDCCCAGLVSGMQDMCWAIRD